MSRDKKSILDFFKISDLGDDEDEFEDDLFDDDDEDDDYVKPSFSQKKTSAPEKTYRSQTASASYQTTRQTQTRTGGAGNKLVDINSRPRTESAYNRGDVFVIKPLDINDAQTIAKYLKTGLTIVINLEGVELTAAQRIIDFVGGSCYALDGSINAISANIFIAAPNTTEVSGDLREEILNSSNISPQLNGY